MDTLRILRIIVALFSSVFLLSCSSGGADNVAGGGIGGTGIVTTTISDPPVCKAPNGDFENVWVTITRVRAHTSTNAGPNDSGWIDLVDLRDKPMQIDLLDLEKTTTDCILTQLGSTSGIPAGQYQQIRFHLLSNTPDANEAMPDSNKCVVGFNCVKLSESLGGAIKILQLSSEAQTGIKIPSGQIAGGYFTVPAGQVVDLNIDFDACASIVLQGNKNYRLKPVLHAGEVSLTNVISGRVVDSDGGAAIENAVVLVEQKDGDIDRVIMQTLTDSNGRFIFCPLPTGTYDVVVSANQTKTYNATITLGVGVGTAMDDIKLYPATGTGTIKGNVTALITGSGQEVDIDISALKYATSSLRVTIPMFQGSTPTTVTVLNGIPTNYSLSVPTGNMYVGTFSGAGTSYSQVSGGYFINAVAENCAQSSQSTDELSVGPGGEVTAPGITFTGCSGNY